MIRDITVLGGGTAGFIAAIALKRKLPHLRVRVLRSADIGVIGVGEGTTQFFPRFFFEQMGLNPGLFYENAEPTWKLGIRFLWGPREHFHYSFTRPIETRWSDLPRNCGFYCGDDFTNLDVWYALMEQDRALPRDAQGRPDFQKHAAIAFHVENRKLVACLDHLALGLGVEIVEGTVESVEKSDAGVGALLLSDGRRITADLYVDASGFRAELLGRALEVPFKSYTDALYCDRAVIGGWKRTDEIIKPYTLAETMDAGWAWQIEHETFLNRGYVYSSSFITDDAAREEFLRKNPKVSNEPRIVKFRSGRYETMWKGNVVGIGNASGFVEPLEASAIQVIILQSRTLADCLADSLCDPPPSVRKVYNRLIGDAWDDVRDFLAVHYKFNTRLDTPFWQAARSDIPLGEGEGVVEFYRENGPSTLGKTVLLSQNNGYGIEGYYAMLLGQKVPHAKPHTPHPRELAIWRASCAGFAAEAAKGFTVREALDIIRRPDWKWS